MPARLSSTRPLALLLPLARLLAFCLWLATLALLSLTGLLALRRHLTLSLWLATLSLLPLTGLLALRRRLTLSLWLTFLGLLPLAALPSLLAGSFALYRSIVSLHFLQTLTFLPSSKVR